MKIHVYIHGDADEDIAVSLDRIEQRLVIIQQQIERNSTMTREEAKRLDTITNDIKSRMDALIAKHKDDLTPEEQAAVDADFATLEGLGKDPDAPIPTV